MSETYIIAGLGNPGAEYRMTRHNAGFMVAEDLATRWSEKWKFEKKFRSDMHSEAVRFPGKKILLCRPQTYMNRSGLAVGLISRFYQVPVERILVIVDDADLELGKRRLKPEGRTGGHRGLESVENALGTRKYARLRLGIGRENQGQSGFESYVLGRFKNDETDALDHMIARAADQVECWLELGMEKAMNRYNGSD
ncbi:MAG TPA: aminoacyl-tRNA hydrolase [Verrucomicrobiales bacterium]|jgi:PTH1 family peptidyl-tRNA hydrolase|nr:aminoacyl-tRNA hydrolase [Verrucomicrobiales bacterium]HIL71096.1 aminoacyl-tRNA hydrolase [Verrucomicrobiota bacterium]